MKKVLEIILTILLLPFALLFFMVLFAWSQSQEIAQEILYHEEIKEQKKKA